VTDQRRYSLEPRTIEGKKLNFHDTTGAQTRGWHLYPPHAVEPQTGLVHRHQQHFYYYLSEQKIQQQNGCNASFHAYKSQLYRFS